MSLESYPVKSYRAGQEIRWAFPREQEQLLYTALKESEYRKYFDFVLEYRQDILKYISLSPSQRSQKKWVNRPDILLIQCTSIQISDVTAQFLGDIRDIAGIVNRDSHRQFHSVIASGILPLLLTNPLYKFPFEGFGNPFSTSG
jgi:hypothetical protein